MKLFKSKWSKWEDLSIGQANFNHYLIQGRRQENGRVQFKVVKTGSVYGCETPTIEQLKKINKK